jgi:glutamate/tyrosine decarboxylase-like PLP-dependent enzyme
MTNAPKTPSSNLDPTDWDGFRAEAHGALDGMIDYLQSLRERPVWTPAPPPVRKAFNAPLPRGETPLAEALADFDALIKPYATGNAHPAFMGWVHGAGTPVGMIAEMLSAGLNANCGGRDHIGIEVEKQVVLWMREAFGFPAGASGLFVTGTSQANFLGVLIGRNRALGEGVRKTGVAAGPRLVAYASRAAHGCVTQAMELAGLGSDQLRLLPCDSGGAVILDSLRKRIAKDRNDGLAPFLVVGTAGSVDIGAIDPLAEIADLCAAENMWFHVDGAFGAMLAFSPTQSSRIAGIERADSIAFDFHKWLHVPYDAGFLLVRDGQAHRRSFASERGYLTRSEFGLAAGETWPCDLGPDLSRGFRALKTWFTLRVFGIDRLGACIDETCRLARRLEAHIQASEHFEMRAPVGLNIVCFSMKSADPDADNRRIVERLHLSGKAAPSITILDGIAVIRCAIVNHRTTVADIDAFWLDLEGARIG